MLQYFILMFAISILLMVFSIMVYRGKADLIRSYHQEKVRIKANYGRAFGKALFLVALAPFVSGIIGLFADSNVSGLFVITSFSPS